MRAFHPWPGAYLPWQDGFLKVHKTHVEPGAAALPGQRLITAGLPAVGTSQGTLVLDEVQPAGKKPMSGKDFLRGARGWDAA